MSNLKRTYDAVKELWIKLL